MRAHTRWHQCAPLFGNKCLPNSCLVWVSLHAHDPLYGCHTFVSCSSARSRNKVILPRKCDWRRRGRSLITRSALNAFASSTLWRRSAYVWRGVCVNFDDTGRQRAFPISRLWSWEVLTERSTQLTNWHVFVNVSISGGRNATASLGRVQTRARVHCVIYCVMNKIIERVKSFCSFSYITRECFMPVRILRPKQRELSSATVRCLHTFLCFSRHVIIVHFVFYFYFVR
jgi:hypothetical protein